MNLLHGLQIGMLEITLDKDAKPVYRLSAIPLKNVSRSTEHRT